MTGAGKSPSATGRVRMPTAASGDRVLRLHTTPVKP